MSGKERPKVLIVDDVSANIKILCDVLEPKGYEILVASSGDAALKIAAHTSPDIIMLDILMPPGIDGYEVCRRLKQNEQTAHIPVIFITVLEEKESIIEGFRSGGVDYINKSFHEEEVLIRVETHLKNSRLTRELLQKNRELQEEIARREQAEKAQKRAEDSLQKADEQLSIISQQEAKRWGIESFVGKSKTIRRILDDVRKLQNAETTTVLITGESGTGKELIARAIHFGGAKAKGQFITLNCSAIPGELAESTLFGHLRGAFTGASQTRKGYFELADGGTLFLDEIGDMPVLLQAKLLRVLEDGCITPVGGREKRVDVRILAATNQNLQAKISQGTFRPDLYFRLSSFTVDVPPLRERKGDIPLLIEHFLNLFSSEMRIPKPVLSEEAKETLEAYHFPGNIRELKNIIEHALIKSEGEAIEAKHLNFINVDYIPIPHPPTPPQENQLPLNAEGTEKPTPNVEVSERRLSSEVGERQLSNEVYRNQANGLSNQGQFGFDTFPNAGNLRPNNRMAHSQMTDEEKILAHVRQHSSINNSKCRELLDVDINRANYLLNKMYSAGVLKRQGSHRWTKYVLNTST